MYACRYHVNQVQTFACLSALQLLKLLLQLVLAGTAQLINFLASHVELEGWHR